AEPDADLLRYVLGIGLAARPAPGDAIDEIVVSLDKLAESRPVPLLRACDQIEIGRLDVVQHHRRHLSAWTRALRHSLGHGEDFFACQNRKRPHKAAVRKSWMARRISPAPQRR